MGRRGPPPEPIELKLLKGNPGKRPLNADAPTPQKVHRPEPPIALNAAALTIWDDLSEKLERIRVLTETDLYSLAKYCDLHAQWIELREDIRVNGYTGTNVNKAGREYTCLRPQVHLFSKITIQLTRMEREFGLTPSSRSSLHVTQPKENPDKSRLYSGQ